MADNLVTPCHGVMFEVSMGREGGGYLSYEVVDGYWCPEPTCNNDWDAKGVASEWNE